jgi:hypothetical protein
MFSKILSSNVVVFHENLNQQISSNEKALRSHQTKLSSLVQFIQTFVYSVERKKTNSTKTQKKNI